MSYCRWSCDFHRSDLYVYQSDRGYESNVAGRRVNVDLPAEILAMPTSTGEEWIAAWKALDAWRDSLKVDDEIPEELWLDLSAIGDEAGQHYLDDTPGECAARLRSLSAKGFNVPIWAIEVLEQERTQGEGSNGE